MNHIFCRIMASRIRLLLFAIVIGGIWPTWGEGAPTQDDWKSPVVFRFGIHANSRVLPDQWAGISADLVNPNSKPAEVLITAYHLEHQELLFQRRVWLPPQARRNVSFPILVGQITSPDDDDASGAESNGLVPSLTTLRATVVDVTDGRQTTIRRSTGEMFFTDDVPVEFKQFRTGIFGDKDSDPDSYYWGSQAIDAFVIDAGKTRETYSFVPSGFPNSRHHLDGYEAILVCGKDLLGDHIAMESLRSWIIDGGSAWVMLDRCGYEVLERMIDGPMPVEMVDRVSFNHLKLDVTPDGGEEILQSVESYFEEPIAFDRTLVDGLQVDVWLEGWPALFWIDLGQGKIMVTTMDARGWLEARGEEATSDPRRQSAFRSIPPLRFAIGEFFPPDDEVVSMTASMKSYSIERVGYQTLSRGTVALTMGTFFVLLSVLSLVLYKVNRVPLLIWGSPIIAIVVASVIFLIGVNQRMQTPETVVDAQYIEFQSPGQQAIVQGFVSAYSAKQLDKSLAGNQAVIIDAGTLDEAATEFQWDDYDSWNQELKIGPGTRQFEYRGPALLAEPVSVSAHFENDRLVGRVSGGAFSDLSDLILATSNGLMTGTPSEAGQFYVNADRALEVGQYFESTILNNEQRRRQRVFDSILGDPKSWNHFQSPRLYFWTDAIETGLPLPDAERLLRVALCSVPIELEQTPPGTKVSLATPWFEMSIRGKDGGHVSIYSELQREWSESEIETDAVLAFALPKEVLPIQLSSAEIEIDLRVEERPCRIYVTTPEGEQTLYEDENAAGRLTFRIDEPQNLQLNDLGEFEIGLSIGDYGGIEAINDWQISDIELKLEGTTVSIEPSP